MNNKLKIIIGIILILCIYTCGCNGPADELGYEYMGIYYEILLTPITTEEINNSTLRELLIEKLENNFSYLSIENENISIWYNKSIYVGYNDLDYNKALKFQYSEIDFLSNSSIMINSRVHRSYGYTGKVSDTKEIANKRAKDLIKEDKNFLNSKISIIIENIKSIYKTEIMYEKYDLEYNK